MKTYDRFVLDIEGTTTSISFVYDELFPFARNEVRNFLSQNWDKLSEVRAGLIAQAEADRAEGLNAPLPDSPEEAAKNVLWQMDQDRKTTALKSLQGMIWKAGYADGRLKGHVFPDVPQALLRWHDRGAKTYIYSSGSIAAQKLLFGHSVAGDLTGLLSGFFDTTTGPKREADSYRLIKEAIGGEHILFATDILQEAQAASEAGFDVVVMQRPGNAEQAAHSFPCATDFEKFK